jgi:Flp pilus assembly protein TadB
MAFSKIQSVALRGVAWRSVAKRRAAKRGEAKRGAAVISLFPFVLVAETMFTKPDFSAGALQ